ncbi:TPA: TrkA family potassium uptake protein [Candidatus Woesearchaeota archaeon]|nr:TrkA family potassium uptake protein [Candidatus Woesearchaeota archaeon]
MAKKNFGVIGLGKFGTSAALTLAKEGKHVLAIDKDEARINSIKDYVTWARQADSTNKDALVEAGIANCDVVIVAIGEDIDASVLATLNLKEVGVEYVVAKASTEQHGKILSKIGADRVVHPEGDTGKRLAWQLMSSDVLEFIELSPLYAVKEVSVPKQFVNKAIKHLHIGTNFGVLVLAIQRGADRLIVPSTDIRFHAEDKITVVGKTEDIKHFSEHFRLK